MKTIMTVLPVKKVRYAIKVFVASALCLAALLLYWDTSSHRSSAKIHLSLAKIHLSPAKIYLSPVNKVKATPPKNETEMYEKLILQDEARVVSGLGEGGWPVHQVGEFHHYKLVKEDAMRKFGFNAYLSDRMAYDRKLKDHRHPECGNVTYDGALPSASVVIVMRREPLSTVLRAVWGVLRAATYGHAQGQAQGQGYLKEVILVDNASPMLALQGRLDHYVRTRLPRGLVRVVRLTRENSTGVVDARLAGARAARGDVLVFLDAHCEPGHDWLRPLLQRVRRRPRTVAAPIIDAVHADTFEYMPKDVIDLQVGGFTFAGEFTWFVVSDREFQRRGPSDVAPTRTPTLPAGVFAVARLWFWRAGGYDDAMRGWGYENLELSFRMWMCGGEVEIVPCSRVGQIFIKYSIEDQDEEKDFIGRNIARTAEVWMDDYKELLYLIRPDLKSYVSEGDVSYRRVVRRRLQCRSFSWYLEHVYPEKFVPVRDTYGFVRFRNLGTGQCLDTLQAEELGAPLGLHPCHPDLTPSQFLTLSLRGELRDELRCAEIQFSADGSGGGAPVDMESDATYRVIMVDCQFKTSNAAWRYVSGRLEHVDTGLCLHARARRHAPGELRAARCTPSPDQAWNAEPLLSPERKNSLSKQQLASLLRIRDSNPAPPAQRDRPSPGPPYTTTGTGRTRPQTKDL